MASLATSQQACTEPKLISTPVISRISTRASRRLSRNLPDSIATVAWMRGPNAPFGDPGGIFPRVKPPHLGQRFFHRRNSLTKVRNSGVSTIWRISASMRGAASSGDPQLAQVSGSWLTTSSTCSGGTISRVVPVWPGCPPVFRPLAFFGGFLRPRSELGGLELLPECCRSCSSSSAILASATASNASSCSIRFARSCIHPG